MSAWVRSVAFLQGESISSWIIRAALAQGCDPLTLTGSIWPRWRVWTLDVDRGLASEKLLVLAKASGVPSSMFEVSCLRIDAEKIAGHQLNNMGTWPWILTLGARNRKRFAGMQYCPACLASDAIPYLRREWRFAWQTSCSAHQILLIDRCWSCDALVTPHRLVAEDEHLAVCAQCKADLRLAKRIAIRHEAKNFQENANAVLANSKADFDNQMLSVHQWFELARFCVGLIRYSARSETSCISVALHSLRIPIASNNPPIFSVQLELLSAVQREILFANVFHLMSSTREDFLCAFKSAGVSMNSLQAIAHDMPYALSEIAGRLANNGRDRRKRTGLSQKPKSKRTVKMMWARLLRKMGIRSDE